MSLFRSESRWERKLPKPLYWILFITFLIVIVLISVMSICVTDELYNTTDNVLEMYDWQDNLHNNNYHEDVENYDSEE